MKKYIIIILVALVSMSLSFAEASKSLPELVDKFFEAVKSKDREIIVRTYKALSENEEVLELTKQEHPDYYKLYESWTAVFKAEGFKELAGTLFGTAAEAPGFVVVKERVGTVVPSQRSNQVIAASYPNQNVPSNQVSIRRRLRSMR
ncbi:MAG: hypothetical protein KJ736_02960 [Candidatus Omnitrophica bacterium]|nr:hypothetical protein [Candidatus Omnitrophota bacterium]